MKTRSHKGEVREVKLRTYIQRLILILVFVFIVANIIMFYYGFQLLEPVDQENPRAEIVEIKEGDTFDEIINNLYNLELIQDPLIFEIYLRFHGLTAKLQAGHYRLDTSMSAEKISKKIVSGDTATHKVSIPEGVRVYDIADRLAKLGFNREKLLELMKEKETEFLPDEQEEINYNLEGFLLPETYYIPYGAKEEEVINLMLREFKKRIKPLREEIEESDFNIHQIVTIASLIEGEVILNSEKTMVASVIKNRLESNMRLQLDATVQYLIDEHRFRILYRDLRIDSPYNTYQRNSLPPGPINNPGINTIKAALNPDDTDYLYYVSAGDGSHIFTKSYQEHLEAIQRVRGYR